MSEMSQTLPFVDLKSQYLALKERIDARIQRVLDHGQYIMGPEVTELETRLAAFTGSRHCITVASGTEALLISLMALDLRPGDEVITTPFTFAATAESIVRLGAVPVFVDIEPDTCNLDASKIEAALTARTKAILPVSLYGQVADMDAINEVAARHGLAVIEDAAQSFGATYRGRRSCHLSTLGCTSFFPSKPLGCYGDGGAVFTDDDALAQACREIRVHGQSARYTHARVGVGGRMDTLQCAIVLAKLERFDWEVARRQALGARYAELLDGLQVAPPVALPETGGGAARSETHRDRRSDVQNDGQKDARADAEGQARVSAQETARQAGGPGITLLGRRGDRDCVWAQYTVFVAHRVRVQAGLQARGVPTAVHYPRPLHRQPAYARFQRAGCDLRNSEAAAERVLSLPMSADLTEPQQRHVAAALGEALREALHGEVDGEVDPEVDQEVRTEMRRTSHDARGEARAGPSEAARNDAAGGEAVRRNAAAREAPVAAVPPAARSKPR